MPLHLQVTECGAAKQRPTSTPSPTSKRPQPFKFVRGRLLCMHTGAKLGIYLRCHVALPLPLSATAVVVGVVLHTDELVFM